MIEELKIIADIMKDVTDGAMYIAILYMAISYLKPISMAAIFSFTIIKVSSFFRQQKVDSKYLEVITKDEL